MPPTKREPRQGGKELTYARVVLLAVAVAGLASACARTSGGMQRATVPAHAAGEGVGVAPAR